MRSLSNNSATPEMLGHFFGGIRKQLIEQRMHTCSDLLVCRHTLAPNMCPLVGCDHTPPTAENEGLALGFPRKSRL